LLRHVLDEAGTAARIERHRHRAARRRAEERHDPLRAAFRQEEHAVAAADPARFQLSGEAEGRGPYALVRPGRGAEAGAMGERRGSTPAGAVVEEAGQVLARHVASPGTILALLRLPRSSPPRRPHTSLLTFDLVGGTLGRQSKKGGHPGTSVEMRLELALGTAAAVSMAQPAPGSGRGPRHRSLSLFRIARQI